MPEVKDSVERFFRSFGMLIERDRIGVLSDIMSVGLRDFRVKEGQLTFVCILLRFLEAVSRFPKQRPPNLNG